MWGRKQPAWVAEWLDFAENCRIFSAFARLQKRCAAGHPAASHDRKRLQHHRAPHFAPGGIGGRRRGPTRLLRMRNAEYGNDWRTRPIEIRNPKSEIIGGMDECCEDSNRFWQRETSSHHCFGRSRDVPAGNGMDGVGVKIVGTFNIQHSTFNIQWVRRWRCRLPGSLSVRPETSELKTDFRVGREKLTPDAAAQSGCSRKRCCLRCCGTGICAISGVRNWVKVFCCVCKNRFPTLGRWISSHSLPPHAAPPS